MFPTRYVALIAALGLICTTTVLAEKPKAGPWDVKAIQLTDVKPEWGETSGKAREVYYPGEPLEGKPTRVFAYYARPTKGDGPFPAVLLVHGGGGKAFREWAEHWAARGYCALAMDLAGNGPKGRLPDGGPDQSDDVKFRTFTAKKASDMWTYHAVAAVLRGHNLLRSLPEVDKDKIAVTGISWGGYLTCIIAGLDDRLKAAVPVYGCGFLHENSYWLEPNFQKMKAEDRTNWVENFDPSKYLPLVKCPILFLNGTNDFAYPLDSYKKCFELVPGAKTLAVRIRLDHGHIWTFGEVDAFIDSHLKGGEPLAIIGEMKRNESELTAMVSSKVEIKLAQLHYAMAEGAWQKREWKSTAASIQNGKITAKLPAERPLAYYLSATDKRGLVASTTHDLQPKAFPGTPAKWQGHDKYDFKVDKLDATVVVPEKALPGRPWVWRGEFFGAFADADAALVKAGWHLAYVSVPDLFGSPKAMKQWEAFYSAMTGVYGLHAKPGLIGLSRGGLYCMNWAALHPDKTLAVYLDNAVCDFKSWPGGKLKKLGTGAGSDGEWKKLLAAYDFKNDAEAITYKLNPVDQLGPMAKANIPLLLVYGDQDTVVPAKENSDLVFDRYRELKAPAERIVKPGQDHHPHGLKDVTPVVKFFTKSLDVRR